MVLKKGCIFDWIEIPGLKISTVKTNMFYWFELAYFLHPRKRVPSVIGLIKEQKSVVVIKSPISAELVS